MNKRKILIVNIFFMMCIFTMGVNSITSVDQVSKENKNNFEVSVGYVAHDRIEIHGNEEFLTMASLEGWSGTGAEGDPIIISGYFIESLPIHPIRIWHTTIHWVVCNSKFTTQGNMCGIWCRNTTNGVIRDNLYTDLHNGLFLTDVRDLTIMNNTIEICNGDGIDLDEGSGILVCNNTFKDIDCNGNELKKTHGYVFENNIVTNVTLNALTINHDSSDITVRSNNISSTAIGVLCSGNNCTISNNIIYNIDNIGVRLWSYSLAETDCFDIIVKQNTLIDCSSYGLKVQNEETNNIEVMYNDFFECGENTVFSDASSCTFDYNFYDIHSTPDADHNGYVDTSFVIEGTAEDQDLHPLALPYNPVPEWCEYVVPTTTSEPTDISSSTTAETEPSSSTTPTGSGYVMDPLILGVGAVGVIAIVLIVVVVVRRK